MKSSPDNTLSLEETLKAILPDGKLSGKLPPVDSWNPQNCGDIDMSIRADGSWWHEGGRMNRERMVKMFSRILRKDEDGKTYLVTPYEKVVVDVEDAPFIAVRVDRAGAAGPQPSSPMLAMSPSPGPKIPSASKRTQKRANRHPMSWCADGWRPRSPVRPSMN